MANMTREYAEDCIHLKACRRMCKYHNINNRGCTKSYCTAYEPKSDFIKVEDAIEVARNLLKDMQYGYSYDDLSVEVVGFMEERSL